MQNHIVKVLKLRRWVMLHHHIPGRIRLKYKLGILTQLVSFNTDKIEQAIAAIPAFKNYKINNTTHSILIEYDIGVIRPEWIDSLFSGSEKDAELACYAIAQQLNLDGEKNV
ncbi:hypothetical protein NFHSH190041_16700 [Shewanella sp. NFH-SH190041]|uniref:HMA2 domain-containing protein n=1 Tax=Shewanella sp. NFH-SH190041 TaxID=2950245 RepID=UPI0021C4B454|nr:hypothetical protein [Shewanella sp. NFH-SH190041]BDM64218.1 hypothetical protein NFHSH190041_16700 [Shewanella sp. NFH-SH190041]